MIPYDIKYYLYQHIRLDTNEIFYIGIGTKPKKYNTTKVSYARAYSKCKKCRSNFWHNVVNKAGYRVEILMESDDYNIVKKIEIELVALYGRKNLGKGELVNLTDGGEGSKGLAQSQETISKRMVKLRGKKLSPQAIQNCLEAKKELIENIRNIEVGKIYEMRQGCKIIVIDYQNSKEVAIRFLESGIIRYNCYISQIRAGRIKDYFYPSARGIGYLGGKVINKKAYEVWAEILKRSETTYPICNEWKNFQNFQKWVEDNYGKVNLKKFRLLSNVFESEQEYSKSNCYFIPKELYENFYPSKGFHKRKKDGKISTKFRSKHLGYFKIEKEAIEKYIEVKKKYILDQLKIFSGVLPDLLCTKIFRYEPTIIDALQP